MVDGAVPGLVVLGTTRKQVEQGMRSKPVGSTPPWPLHQLLPPGSHQVCCSDSSQWTGTWDM